MAKKIAPFAGPSTPNQRLGEGGSGDGASGAGVRLIKKYPNRRLYDTHESCYIALSDVRQMVLAGESFQVHDAKTGINLTRSLLLQIILEAELDGVALFSEAALANIIRFYGNTMQGALGTYLEQNMQAFSDMHRSTQAAAMGKTGQHVVGAYADQTQAALRLVQSQMQAQAEQLLRSFGIKR